MIEMGDTVRDRYTELVGVVTGERRYINNPVVEYLIQPRGLTESGFIHEAIWLDEVRLDVVGS